MFENVQTENKLRPSFASLSLGTFPPRWDGMKRLTVFAAFAVAKSKGNCLIV